jgi:hypothetical protein
LLGELGELWAIISQENTYYFINYFFQFIRNIDKMAGLLFKSLFFFIYQNKAFDQNIE